MCVDRSSAFSHHIDQCDRLAGTNGTVVNGQQLSPKANVDAIKSSLVSAELQERRTALHALDWVSCLFELVLSHVTGQHGNVHG